MTIRLDDELYKKVKIKAINEDKTFQAYIVSLIEADLEKDKEK